ncbi:tRNA (adenosine(37)-N6)-threonylcarbamoyltransferase complex ATPase subunit type 1 TsaE [Planktotalea sp.]|uniref:tRNA (adenosine(37)-N6)-threonylcarbamoyltransferase complex ATPase subunit type 1 TsaE n=1 Tax=Planktotalea sp. TaxID=2029877 RepID=UPI0025D079AD|nr:tRNA (adenosine(37)-N6)-threonylcarbamoyltransferase complex ATPase subunit type 1 TsaE [Planktotalea sp.]
MSITLPNLLLDTPSATTEIASRIGACLIAGDTLLLHGDIGAGKSYFARALIQSLQDRPEDVPSPTFTLVQTYETQLGEVWHADLYRLSDPGEAEELGLTDAFSSAICLIEWPDRLASLAPKGALSLHFQYTDNNTQRDLSFMGGSDTLCTRISRALA